MPISAAAILMASLPVPASEVTISLPSKLETAFIPTRGDPPTGPADFFTTGTALDQIEPRPDGRVFFGSGGLGVFTPNLSQFNWFGSVPAAAPFSFDSSGRVLARRAEGVDDPDLLPVVVRLLSDGALDPTFSAPVANRSNRRLVSAIALQPDGKVLLGTEIIFGVDPPYWEGWATRVIRLNADGSKDQTFQSPLVGGSDVAVRVILVLADGKILISGHFGIFFGDGTATGGVARLNADGTVDPSFRASFSQVYALRLLADGKILIGGDFVGGLARLHANGSTDSSFVPSPTPGLIRTIALQPDGRFIASGAVTAARFFPDGALDGSFSPRSENDAVEVRPSYGLAVDASGRILISGGTRNGVYRYSGQLRIQGPASGAPQILERSEFPDTGWSPVQNIPANTPIDYVQIGYPSPINAFYRARPVQ